MFPTGRRIGQSLYVQVPEIFIRYSAVSFHGIINFVQHEPRNITFLALGNLEKGLTLVGQWPVLEH